MTVGTRGSLPAPTEDLERAKSDLDEHGYCLVRNALRGEEVDALRSRLVEQAAGEEAAGCAWRDSAGHNQRVWMLLNKGEAFWDLIVHPMAGALMTHLLEEDHILSSITANIAGRGGSPMVLHSDQGYVTFPQPPYPLTANIMWMLDDFTEDNGATRVVPGSHLSGTRPDPNDPPESIAVTGPAGTAMCFDGRLWHGTGANTTPNLRHGILTYFCRPFVRQQENFTVSLAPEVLEKMPSELRARVGFKVWRTLGGVEGPWMDELVERPEAPITVLRP